MYGRAQHHNFDVARRERLVYDLANLQNNTQVHKKRVSYVRGKFGECLLQGVYAHKVIVGVYVVLSHVGIQNEMVNRPSFVNRLKVREAVFRFPLARPFVSRGENCVFLNGRFVTILVVNRHVDVNRIKLFFRLPTQTCGESETKIKNTL